MATGYYTYLVVCEICAMVSNGESPSASRRSFMKSATLAGAGVIGLSQSTRSVAAYQEKNRVWRKEDKDTNYHSQSSVDYATELCSSMVYFGSTVNTRDRWQHNFNVGATYTSNIQEYGSDSWDNYNDILNTRLNVENYKSGSTSLFDSNNRQRVGAKPQPDAPNDGSVNYGNVAFTAFTGAVSIASPALAPYATAGQIVSSLAFGYVDGNDKVWDNTWRYNNKPNEAKHYYDFLIVANNQQTSSAHFGTDQRGFSDTASGGQSQYVTRDIYVDPVENLSVDGSKMSDSSGVADRSRGFRSYEEESGVEIPNGQIPENTQLKEFAAGGPVKHVALPVYVESETSEQE